ncbi:MAG: ChaN family lipoprotein [Burkholderiaceae bacterium]
MRKPVPFYQGLLTKLIVSLFLMLVGHIFLAGATADAQAVRAELTEDIRPEQRLITQLKPRRWLSSHFAGHPLVGTVWRGHGERSSWRDLSDGLRNARFVLLGEVHTNADHHLLQARVIEALASLGRKPVVVWEMISQNHQAVLDSPGLTTAESVRALNKELNWANSGWPQWSMYEPIALAAVAYGLPMRGAALDQQFVRGLPRAGKDGLSEEVINRLHLAEPLSDANNQSMLDALDKGHCGLVPKESLAPMQWVQRARDGAMADAMLRTSDRDDANKDNQESVLIAGNGHIRKDWGVPAVLSRAATVRSEDTAILSIAQIEVSEGELDPADYVDIQTRGSLYDFVVFTPRSEIKDHCAELRKRFKR